MNNEEQKSFVEKQIKDIQWNIDYYHTTLAKYQMMLEVFEGTLKRLNQQ